MVVRAGVVKVKTETGVQRVAVWQLSNIRVT